MTQRHFVDVWNPSYASNAMEAHLAILLGAARRFDQDDLASDDEIYVWWGKVRSPNRRQPLGKLDAILRIGAELEAEPEREGHLYLTDYRALYVGHVAGVTEQDVRRTDGARVPDYYARNHLECDVWYKLMDVRRLVADDTLAVIAELRQLRNVEYHDRPVSLYGGMVDLPLVVVRPGGGPLFDPERRDPVTDGKLWVEPAARTFIAGAEKIFRDHRADAAFDFGPVMSGLAKALEVSCNAILGRVIPTLPDRARRANLDGRTVDLADRRHLMLGQFARAVGGERELNAALIQRLEHGGWFAGSLPSIVEELLGVRNPGVHERRVDRDTATRLRDRLMGVGCEGTFAELARVRVKGVG